MLFEAILFGFAAGFLLGGNLSSLAKTSFRGLPLIFASAAIDIVMSTRAGVLVASWGSWALITAMGLQTALLIIFVLANKEKPALWLIGMGGLMNAIAVMTNSGKMPISPEILAIAPWSPYTMALLRGRVANYALATSSTRFLALSDIIPFRGFTFYMISAGDMVTSAGLIVLVISLMLAFSRKKAPAYEATPKENAS